MDLPSEEAAWEHQKAALASKRQSLKNYQQPKKAATTSDGTKKVAKVWHFNLSTYKMHALENVAKAICMFGTTDSYNTQVVS